MSCSHDRHVTIDDPLLPAAAHLTGPGAVELLRPAVAAEGGVLVSCRTSQVQYRPESDLVVRYRCEIHRNGAIASDTLLAATTVGGPYPGTLPIEAMTPDGATLSVGVWRWPFDPVLAELRSMVTPSLARERLGDLVGSDIHVDVVAYRPTERAVVRLRGDRSEIYVKVVPPAVTASLIARHRALGDAGLPVPSVLRSGTGWIAMAALRGTTLRDRLKSGSQRLPAPDRYRRMLETLSAVHLDDAAPVRSRIEDAPHHAAMIATVLPDAGGRLDDIVGRLSAQPVRSALGTVHGDLHEAQLVVDDDAVTGLLDIDDVGCGDRLDDVATLVGHLEFRAASAADSRVDDYAGGVRAALSREFDETDVDRHIAAVLVGLATGPFRIQQERWEATTLQVLDMIEHHLTLADQPIEAPVR
jgi:aminoglycoside phosphotransferase (APT) family kinase protein